MTTTPMSPAELLEKLRAELTQEIGYPLFKIGQDDALALLTTWRDAHGRAEREKCEAALGEIAEVWVGGFSGLPTGDDVAEFICNTLIPALQERPNE